MSFEILKKEIIDAGLCQGCALCAGSCKHVEMKNLRPTLKDNCILEQNGVDCGKCYQSCPQVIQEKFEMKDPKGIYSLRTKDEEILKNASSGGFVITMAKYLLEENILSEIAMAESIEDMPKGSTFSDSKEIAKHASVVYGRTGILETLVKLIGETRDPTGVIGVSCEMRGVANMESKINKDILKLGLFCNSSLRSKATDAGMKCSPCCYGCPSGVNAQGYVALIREQKYQDAVDLIRENNPLPSICGRICTHECEFNCTLIGTESHPVAVRELKKFVTEWEMKSGKKEESKKTNKNAKKVAIIGSGPAGLTAAYYLAKIGHAPTIFEKSDQVGGMLRFGIPKFRLPNYVLDYDIEMIKKEGVDIQTNTAFGPNLTLSDLKKKGFDATFIATGQYKPRTLRLEGEDLPNVHVAINFLIDRKYRHNENTEEFKGKTVGIIGGGPVAVDVAQTALRLGAEKVHLVDILSEKALELVLREIPEEEYKFTKYHFETSTSKITKSGDRLALNCHKIEWGKSDQTGKRPLNKIDGSEYEIPIDSIVIAVGQSVDFDLIDDATENKLKKERNLIIADEITFETNIMGVFAGGDIILNSRAVAIAAIAHGQEAAISIDRYLKGEDMTLGRMKKENSFITGPRKPPKDYSEKPEYDDATREESWSFDQEIEGMFDEETALNESRRCLSCNSYCTHCQDFPAIHSDIAAGEVGSEEGFTTVIAWTERGKELVEAAIKKGLFEEGKVNEEEFHAAIKLKSERIILEHDKTPRQKVLDFLTTQGSNSIVDMAEKLSLEPKIVRYEALKLVQMMLVDMKIEPDTVDPIFSLKTE